MMDINIKALNNVGVYEVKQHSERPDVFRRIDLFFKTSRRIVLAKYWHYILEPNIAHVGQISGTNDPDVKPL